MTDQTNLTHEQDPLSILDTIESTPAAPQAAPVKTLKEGPVTARVKARQSAHKASKLDQTKAALAAVSGETPETVTDPAALAYRLQNAARNNQTSEDLAGDAPNNQGPKVIARSDKANAKAAAKAAAEQKKTEAAAAKAKAAEEKAAAKAAKDALKAQQKAEAAALLAKAKEEKAAARAAAKLAAKPQMTEEEKAAAAAAKQAAKEAKAALKLAEKAARPILAVPMSLKKARKAGFDYAEWSKAFVQRHGVGPLVTADGYGAGVTRDHADYIFVRFQCPGCYEWMVDALTVDTLQPDGTTKHEDVPVWCSKCEGVFPRDRFQIDYKALELYARMREERMGLDSRELGIKAYAH